MLFHFISLVLLLSLRSQRSGAYFVVFSTSFFSRLVTHEQLILSVITCFNSCLIMRAWTLLASTSWCSANRGTSQNTCASFAPYTGFGFSGEYQGVTESARPRSCKISKKSILRAALFRVMYLFCARAVQPVRTRATLSGALLHSLHVTLPVISVCVFWQAYNLVGINYYYHYYYYYYYYYYYSLVPIQKQFAPNLFQKEIIKLLPHKRVCSWPHFESVGIFRNRKWSILTFQGVKSYFYLFYFYFRRRS